MSVSLTKAISAGARRPDWYVYAARIAKAMMSAQVGLTCIALSTASMPTSCSAMYGIVATIPVTATSSAMVEEPDRARTKSAGVTKPCRCDTDHRRTRTTNTIGYTMTVYGTAKNPVAPAPNSSAGTATKVYAVYRSPPIRNQVTQEPKL